MVLKNTHEVAWFTESLICMFGSLAVCVLGVCVFGVCLCGGLLIKKSDADICVYLLCVIINST